MQQINVYGCRGYLENVASNQNTQLLSIVIIRVPFEYAMIHVGRYGQTQVYYN